MNRRDALKGLGALGLSTLVAGRGLGLTPARRGYDVLVVGAGVFGVWTAYYLHRAGRRVAVIDAFGPAHGGASSGGESRVTRCGYGDAELYTEWACRSIADWQGLSERAALPLYHPLGVLWIHREGDEYVRATVETLSARGIPFERWPARELRRRFPVMKVASGEAGMFEPRGGGLMARRAVQTLAAELEEGGVTLVTGKVSPVRAAAGVRRALPSVATAGGERIEAERFVFACGPWLDQVCPEAMAERLFPTRQEVFYFAVGPSETGPLPVWADLPFYGLPSLEGRGFKVADDTHGPPAEPSTMSRRPSAEGERRAREFLARRFPALADAPLAESRVCAYENSSNGDFVIDRHPGFDNVWLAGCGSGHGFKHGPAVGAHLAGLLLGTERPIDRFRLDAKETRQQRAIQ